MPMRAIMKRFLRRSMIGSSVVTSVVLPGYTARIRSAGHAWASITTASTTCFEVGPVILGMAVPAQARGMAIRLVCG